MESPLTLYALLALGMGACVYLFLTLSIEIQAGRKKRSVLEATVEALKAQLEDMSSRLDETEDRSAVPASPGASHALNLNVRSKALRMARRGDSNQQIAAALGVPEQEVELLLKVQRMMREATPPAGPEENPPEGWEALLKAALQPQAAPSPTEAFPVARKPETQPSQNSAGPAAAVVHRSDAAGNLLPNAAQ